MGTSDNVTEFPAPDTCDVTVTGVRPLIKPGEYQLTFLGHETISQFKTAKLALRFRVVSPGAAFNLELFRYYNIKAVAGKGRRKNGRFTVGPCSDFYREYCMVFGRPVRRDRLSVSRYRNSIVIGEVDTVTRGHDQRELHEATQYSVIRRLLRLEAGGW